MRISIFLLFVCVLQLVAVNTEAQSAVVRINTQSVTVGQLLKEIESQTDYLVVFRSREVSTDRVVAVKNSSADIASLLKDAFSQTDIEYFFENNYIILSKRDQSQTLLQTPQQTGKKITGIITDQHNEPIIGANIIVKGTTNGVITNIDGEFMLTVPDNAVLQISYIGYQSREVTVGNQSTINLQLVEDTHALDEVIIVGYGTQKKANLTGAVAQIKMDEVLGDRPVINTKTALQGTMPGLVISGGSKPGESKEINIRGTTSINGGEPLVLIDNVPGDIDMLNPEDIESVSILKDAASSAIYGARAAFGVVLITTKKGQKEQRFTLQYNNNFGFENAINRPKQTSSLDFLRAYKDAGFLSGNYFAGQNVDKWIGYLEEYKQNPSKFETVGDGIYIPTEDNPGRVRYYLNEKDLYANIFDDYGFLQSHNVSASGGTSKLTYRLSLGYNDEQGVLLTDKDRYKRITSGVYILADITDWISQSMDVRYARSQTSEPNIVGGNLYDMRLCSLTPEGEMELDDGTVYPMNTPKDMLLNSPATHKHTENPRIFSTTRIKPVKGLEAIIEYTYDKKVYDEKKYNHPFWYTSIQLGKSRTANTSKYENVKQSVSYNAFNAYVTYSLDLKEDHHLKIMGGFNQESSNLEKLEVTRLEMINEDMPSFSSATGETTAKDTYTLYSIRSGFYRVNYDYKNKYLFEANGRYDGSSKFPKKSRFGFFPSFSAGWNVAEESFMQKFDWLDQLKLRAAWGQIGNQNIKAYQYTPTMEASKANWIYGGIQPTTLGVPGLVSSNFTWETVESTNIGLDMSFLNTRLQVSADWYIRDTKDMLTKGMELPAVVGADAPLQNVADLRTKGWELSANWRDKIGKVRYSVGFNVFDSQTKVTKFDNEAGLFYEQNSAQEAKRYREGMYIGEIWGYVSNGFYTIDDFENTTTWKLKEGVTSIQGVTVKPGDVKYKNLRDDENTTNMITEGTGTAENPGDRKVIGNSSARYHYGISANVNWNGFDLSILMQGVAKRDYWANDDRRWSFNSGEFGSIFEDQLDYWQPRDWQNGDYTAVNPNAKFFRIYNQRENAGSNTKRQTQYLLDASYLRIKNITLSYTVPSAVVQKYSLNGLKIFVSGENLATFHSLPSGYDPERLSWAYPFYRTISFGLNISL